MLKKFLIAIAGFILVLLTLGAVKAKQIADMMSVSHVPPPAVFQSRVAGDELAREWNSVRVDEGSGWPA